MHINPYISLWETDFLSNRTQSVKYLSNSASNSNCRSEKQLSTHKTTNKKSTILHSSIKTTNTGAPQGTVIAPFLFTLYTNDCRPTSQQTSIIKFSDDTAIIDTSDSHTSYQNEIDVFTEWCECHFLNLNVNKTKEMLFDLKRNKNFNIPKCFIKGEEVERVDCYKYLGTIIDDKLLFDMNCDMIFKKCRQRMHVLYSLRAFHASGKIIERCYKAFVLPVLTFSMVCWFGSLNDKERKRLNGIVHVCEKIVGSSLQTLEDLYRVKSLSKSNKIINESSHVLNYCFDLLPSRRRFRQLKFRTNRFRNTFIPNSINLLNSKKSSQ